MHFLYGAKKNVERRLDATFSSEQQLLAYARWTTLKDLGAHHGKFDQASALAGCEVAENFNDPLTDEDAGSVVHDPTTSMLRYLTVHE